MGEVTLCWVALSNFSNKILGCGEWWEKMHHILGGRWPKAHWYKRRGGPGKLHQGLSTTIPNFGLKKPLVGTIFGMKKPLSDKGGHRRGVAGNTYCAVDYVSSLWYRDLFRWFLKIWPQKATLKDRGWMLSSSHILEEDGGSGIEKKNWPKFLQFSFTFFQET
ncbi:hypothetical protein DFH07DRAFT_777187 [Mycena maculata]|uniref:Uncharacterized protein n=1 Tax=Mycena maculata TaxID=230809 RepID=A0AAD7IL51_9AGAR|nr:hypothetical protein DFH07DRAFT_777187 [Mycena maculata]